MKVRVDPSRCQGHGRCFEIAPDLFVSDDGYGTAKDDGPVPTALEQVARSAVTSCPESAIDVL